MWQQLKNKFYAQSNNFQGNCVGGACFATIVFVFILLFWLSYNHSIKPEVIHSREVGAMQYVLSHPKTGNSRLTRNGMTGIIIRKCWLGTNRYEFRLPDGTITYVTGNEFVIKEKP